MASFAVVHCDAAASAPRRWSACSTAALGNVLRASAARRSSGRSGSAAGRGLFYAVTAAGPSRPAGQVLGIAAQPGYRSRFAYHQFDLLWAMEEWNWFANFNGVPADQLYVPDGEDRAQAALLREVWFGFAASGTPPGVPPFVAANVAADSDSMS